MKYLLLLSALPALSWASSPDEAALRQAKVMELFAALPAETGSQEQGSTTSLAGFGLRHRLQATEYDRFCANVSLVPSLIRVVPMEDLGIRKLLAGTPVARAPLSHRNVLWSLFDSTKICMPA